MKLINSSDIYLENSFHKTKSQHGGNAIFDRNNITCTAVHVPYNNSIEQTLRF